MTMYTEIFILADDKGPFMGPPTWKTCSIGSRMANMMAFWVGLGTTYTKLVKEVTFYILAWNVVGGGE